ncbi:hypothetical protein [Microcoleus sp. herbarium14]|uniref:hypothetical protein n=1 Tax=Microcoleus sp. herbarium14 TaxID=3055439 RepID=UPI002FCED8C2
MIDNKYEIEDYESLEWNAGHTWAIPLPEYSINAYLVSRHYIPSESPVIPTGWIYERHDGRLVSEAELSRAEF